MFIFNRIKTIFLLGTLSGLLAGLGYAFGGMWGGLYALIFACIGNFITYFYSDRIVLRLYGAQPLSESEHASVYATVRDLAGRMNMPMPRLYLLPQAMPNAFATGRNPQNSAIAVTTGILELLDEDELTGVLAHELSHIKNRDVLVATIAATVATAIAYLADMIRWSLFWGARGRDSQNRNSGIGLFVIALLTPFIAMLLQLAISRSREYLADESGAECCGNPLALASALRKLKSGKQEKAPSTAHASAASLFIVYPFSSSGLLSLFSTHPPLDARIAKLEKMASKR
jgi:heat shock protein HtpX